VFFKIENHCGINSFIVKANEERNKVIKCICSTFWILREHLTKDTKTC